MAERLLDLGGGLAIYTVNVDEVREQDVNARSMQATMFERLTKTIGRDKRLESLPLVALVDMGQDTEHFEIVSGHHRFRASRAAGLYDIKCIVDETGLTPAQIKAKQLAHNSIAGSDDEQMLARIFADIDDVDARLEAFIDEKELLKNVPDKVPLPDLDIDISYRSVLMMFLPTQEELFNRALDSAVKHADLKRDQLALVDAAMFDRWQAAMRRLRREYDARSASTLVALMLDAVAEKLGIPGSEVEDFDEFEGTSLPEILGSGMLTAEETAVVREAVELALKRKEVTKKDRAKLVVGWAESYLGKDKS
jgi:ParB-like chromosome segregation protein Spo0J